LQVRAESSSLQHVPVLLLPVGCAQLVPGVLHAHVQQLVQAQQPLLARQVGSLAPAVRV
jgi:hypothetical protein